jgi:hypothetical protein
VLTDHNYSSGGTPGSEPGSSFEATGSKRSGLHYSTGLDKPGKKTVDRGRGPRTTELMNHMNEPYKATKL